MNNDKISLIEIIKEESKKIGIVNNSLLKELQYLTSMLKEENYAGNYKLFEQIRNMIKEINIRQNKLKEKYYELEFLLKIINDEDISKYDLPKLLIDKEGKLIKEIIK